MVTSGPVEVTRLKNELRQRQRAGRAALFAQASPTMFAAAAGHFLKSVELRPGGVIAGYWPIRDEFDSRPLLEAIAANGGRLAMPVVEGDSGRLIFREWASGGALVPAGFGTFGPSDAAREVEPEVIIAPLLAFDRRGYRLGYGGGFYDRSLTALRAAGKCKSAIGLGFAAQRVQQVPAGGDDARLDMIVTETGAIQARL